MFPGQKTWDKCSKQPVGKCSNIQDGDELSLRWGLHAPWHIDTQTKVNRIPAPSGSCLWASGVWASPEVMYNP